MSDVVFPQLWVPLSHMLAHSSFRGVQGNSLILVRAEEVSSSKVFMYPFIPGPRL